MDVRFDLDNIFSKHDAQILESLLDSSHAQIEDVIQILLGKKNLNIDDFLVKVITSHSYLVKNTLLIVLNYNHRIISNLFFRFYICTLYSLLDMLSMYFTIDHQQKLVMVNTDNFITAMIVAGVLPEKIIRLPRQASINTENKAIQIIPSYYEIEFSSIPHNLNEILYHPINFTSSIPITYTYEAAIAILSKNGIPKSVLNKSIMEQKIFRYIEATDEDIINRSVYRYSKQSIATMIGYSCGNSYYLKRYPGLERLKFSVSKNLRHNNPIKIRIDTITDSTRKIPVASRRSLQVEKTDLETKMYIERSIKSCNGKNIIPIEDTVYLKDDIDQIIANETTIPKENGIPKNTRDEQIQVIPLK